MHGPEKWHGPPPWSLHFSNPPFPSPPPPFPPYSLLDVQRTRSNNRDSIVSLKQFSSYGPISNSIPSRDTVGGLIFTGLIFIQSPGGCLPSNERVIDTNEFLPISLRPATKVAFLNNGRRVPFSTWLSNFA